MIYVDLNDRIKPESGEFFKVDLAQLAGHRLLERVRATDHDELEFTVVIVARRNDLGYGIVELDRTDTAPKHLFMNGPAIHIAGWPSASSLQPRSNW